MGRIVSNFFISLDGVVEQPDTPLSTGVLHLTYRPATLMPQTPPVVPDAGLCESGF